MKVAGEPEDVVNRVEGVEKWPTLYSWER